MKNKFQKVPKARRNVTIIFREEGCSENRDEQEWSSRPVPHLPAFFIKVRPRELAERKIFSYTKRTKADTNRTFPHTLSTRRLQIEG